MDGSTAALWGMVGGAVVEAIALWGHVVAWQQARHQARLRGQPLPKLARYVDPAADALVALSRLILGALAGLLLHAEISGVVSAIGVGAAAPALLGQLGALFPPPSKHHQPEMESTARDLTLSPTEGAVE